MSKKNKGKQINNLYNYFRKNIHQDQNIQQFILKNQGKKKVCPKISQDVLHDQKKSCDPITTKRNSIFFLAKDVQVQQLLSKCPKLQTITAYIEEVVSQRKELVKKILQKYMQSSSHSLWSFKYAPNDCSELFNKIAGQKIKDWLNAFFEYKNKPEDDPLLEEKSSSIKKKIRKNKWKLEALVVKGRAGIGKSSAIKAVAQQMQIDIQQCGNHYNPVKYLKQKNESTQSQSVKIAMSRKIKLQKHSQIITKYLPSVDKEKTIQARKCQLIHNVGMIYPQSEASKFYSELSRCIQFSKIPFILTDSSDRLPNQCQNYDQIDFQVGQHRLIQSFLWIVYQIENILQIRTNSIIDKDNFFDEINKQIEFIDYKQLITFQKIRNICCLHNYRLDHILTYLQQHKIEKTTNLHQFFQQKYSNFTRVSLMQSIPYLKQTLKFNCIQDSSKSLLSIAEQSNESHQDWFTQDSFEDSKASQLITYKQNLKRTTSMEILPKGNDDQQQYLPEYQISQTVISSKIHQEVKKKLANKINQQINANHAQYRSTLTPSDLIFLPMLIIKSGFITKANSEEYEKYFDPNQCLYLQRYGHFIKKS